MIGKWCLILMVPFFLSHCGSDDDDSLEAQLVPNESLVLPGEGKNCEDEYNRSILGEDFVSVQPFRIYFSSFRLRWTSTVDDLYLAEIRLTSADGDPNIKKFSESITGEELDLLLGVENGYVQAADESVSCAGGSIQGCREIVSNDPDTKEVSSVSCGLNMGGLSLVDEDARFTTTLEVRVIGYSINVEDGTQKPQRANFTVRLRRE